MDGDLARQFALNFLAPVCQTKWKAMNRLNLEKIIITNEVRSGIHGRIHAIFRSALGPHYGVFPNSDMEAKCSITAFLLTLGGDALM